MRHPEKKTAPGKKRLWIPAAVLCAALLLTALLPRLLPEKNNAADPITHEHPVKSLAPAEERAVERITVSPAGEAPYTLITRDGTLLLEQDGGLLPVREDMAAELLDIFTSLTVQDTISEDLAEVEGNLQDMGLTEPRSVVLVQYADGASGEAQVGANVPETGYSYFRWSEKDGVYACDSGVAEALCRGAARLLPVEQPEVEASLIDRIVLTRNGLRMAFRFPQDEAGKTAPVMEEPFRYPLAADAAEGLLSAVSSLRLGTPISDPESGGFDAPLLTLEIAQAEGLSAETAEDGGYMVNRVPAKDFTFVLGREDGEYFLTCRYGGGVYLTSRFPLKTLLEITPESAASRCPFDPGEAGLASLVLETAGETHTVTVTREESVLPNNELETDAKGDPVIHLTVLSDGRERSAEWLEALEEALRSLTVSGEVPSDFRPEGEMQWRASLTMAGGETRVIAGWRVDAFFSAVETDGVILHTVYTEEIERLTALLKAE